MSQHISCGQRCRVSTSGLPSFQLAVQAALQAGHEPFSQQPSARLRVRAVLGRMSTPCSSNRQLAAQGATHVFCGQVHQLADGLRLVLIFAGRGQLVQQLVDPPDRQARLGREAVRGQQHLHISWTQYPCQTMSGLLLPTRTSLAVCTKSPATALVLLGLRHSVISFQGLVPLPRLCALHSSLASLSSLTLNMPLCGSRTSATAARRLGQGMTTSAHRFLSCCSNTNRSQQTSSVVHREQTSSAHPRQQEPEPVVELVSGDRGPEGRDVHLHA